MKRAGFFGFSRRAIQARGELELVRCANCKAVSAVFILGAVVATERWFGVVNLDRLFFQVRVSHVDNEVVIDGIASTQAENRTVASRDARRAIFIVGRRLVPSQTGTQDPLLVQLIRSTDGVCPGIVPILLFGDGAKQR